MKFHHTLFYLLVLIGIGLPACKKDNLIEVTGIHFLDMAYCFEDLPNELVINQEAVYLSLRDKRTDSLPCRSYQLPFIDFSERTLLGKFTEGQGCEAEYFTEMFVNPDANTYIYKVLVRITNVFPDCMGNNLPNRTWITVPKLLDNYEIEFEVQYEVL